MILNLSYGSGTLLKVVNIDYDDATHAIISGSIGSVDIPSGLGPGVEFYRQNEAGEYWALKVQNAAPYAYVDHVTIALPEDITIDAVAIVKQTDLALGSVTVTASGTGTLRYTLSAVGPQVSNVFNNVYAGDYTVEVTRLEDGYFAIRNITVGYVPNLEVNATATDCSANGIDDGNILLTVLNGSGNYTANFITEGVSIDLTTAANSTTRVNLTPGSYEIEVTDNESLQQRSVTLNIAYPAIVIDDSPTGTLLEFTPINSISFVVPNEQPQQLDNVLFADQVFPGYDKACYHQPFLLTDEPRIQFKSNFGAHALKLLKLSNDVEIKQFPISLTEQNIGATADYQLIIKEYLPASQSKVYFQSGGFPIPVAIGDVFEISNNADGFNGLYSILNIILEESTGLRTLIINLNYTAGAISSTATGTFDNQLADYNVYESKVMLSDVAQGIYYLVLTASDPFIKLAISEPINVRVEHTGTLAIVYSNTNNDFDAVWTTGYRGFVRVAAAMFKRTPGGERSIARDSNDSLVKIRARKRRIVIFETDLLPPYMVEKLSLIFDCDFFSINALAFQSSEGLEEPDYMERSRLAMVKIKLEQLNWFTPFNSNKDMVTDNTGACVCDNIDLLSVSTAADTIRLTMAMKLQRIFSLVGVISTPKTIDLTEDILALSFKIIFTIGDVAAVLTWQDNFKMKGSDPRWDDGAKTFTPMEIGTYEGEAVWDGTYWRLDLNV